MTVTVADLRNFVKSKMEDNGIPLALLEVLRKHNGKKLTKRILPDLKAVEPSCNIDHSMTYSEICWREKGNDRRIMVGRKTMDQNSSEIVIDADYAKEQSPWCFRALDERNASRTEFLKDPALFEILADKINAYNVALAELAEAFDNNKIHDGGQMRNQFVSKAD